MPTDTVLVLDGVTNPSNVGMILRTATAAGVAGIVLPRVGSPGIDPLVVKASAGVAYRAPILRCRTATDGVRTLRGWGGAWRVWTPPRLRISMPQTCRRRRRQCSATRNRGPVDGGGQLVDSWVSIPMAGRWESLNVSSAAAVLRTAAAPTHGRAGTAVRAGVRAGYEGQG